MVQRREALRRSDLRVESGSAERALLFCPALITMSVGRMIQKIIRCQTCRLAAKSIGYSVDFAFR
jgi:hypothetical protein